MATELSGPFDTGSWTQDQWYRHASAWARSGVRGVPASATTAGTLPLTINGLTVTLGSGRAWVRGAGYELTDTKAITVPANANSNPRIDRLVLRRDLTAKTVTAVLIQGTPAATPAKPALTQVETGQWDEPLFYWTTPANSGTTLGSVTDERTYCPDEGTASALTAPAAWGSLTYFPARPMLGDTVFRSDVGVAGSTWRYTAAGWRHAEREPLTLATLAARDAINAYVYDGLECIVQGLGRFIYYTAQPGWQWIGTWVRTMAVSDPGYLYQLSTSLTTIPGSSNSVWVPNGRTLDVEFTALGHTTGAIAFVQLYIGGVLVDSNVLGGPAGGDAWQTIRLQGSGVGTGTTVTYNVAGYIQNGTEADVRALTANPAGALVVERHRIV